MDIWVISIFWLLWIMLLWIFIYKFLCGHMFSLLFGMYLGVELPNHMILPSIIAWGAAILFSKEAALFLLSQAVYKFLIAFVVGVKWYLLVVFIYISLKNNNVEHLYMCLGISSLEKYLLRSFVYFKIGSSIFLLWNCKSSLSILNPNHLSDMICKYFLSFCRLFFNFLDSVIWSKNMFIL